MIKIKKTWGLKGAPSKLDKWKNKKVIEKKVENVCFPYFLFETETSSTPLLCSYAKLVYFFTSFFVTTYDFFEGDSPSTHEGYVLLLKKITRIYLIIKET